MGRPVVLLTISANTGADYLNTPYYKSRAEYAIKHGYDEVTLLPPEMAPATSSWVKVPVMMHLAKKFDVLFLDNDVVVNDTAPSVEEFAPQESGFYAALGHSGRPNAGVLLSRGGEIEPLKEAMKRRSDPPPLPLQAPYENGHLIWALRDLGFFALSKAFNDCDGDDGFFIHHTGPNLDKRSIVYDDSWKQSSSHPSFKQTVDDLLNSLEVDGF